MTDGAPKAPPSASCKTLCAIIQRHLRFTETKTTTMKKIILTLTAIVFTSFLFGQTTTSDTTKKEFKNVVGLDATGLLRQFFNLNTTSYYSYPYIISYKRIFKSDALRISAGGNIYTNNGTTNDTLEGKTTRNELYAGIGFEHYSYISKRWNIYFGADAIVNYKNYDQQSSRTATTSYRYIQTQYGYGASPLLGIQFIINSRLSVATETSYDITFTTTTASRTETPASIYDTKSKSNGIETQFHAPTGIIFRILF